LLQENVNRAAIADMFGARSAQCSTAYSATGFFTGYASAMGYFSFYAVDRLSMAGVVLSVSAVSLVCYQSAFLLNKKMAEKRTLDSQRKDIVKQKFFQYVKERELPAGWDRDPVFTNSMTGSNNSNNNEKKGGGGGGGKVQFSIDSKSADVSRVKSDDLL
jgi:hypothetical protein